MKNRRSYILIGFFVWWSVWGSLLSGIPFRIGEQKLYSAKEGCGTYAYKDLDIKNVQRQKMSNFQSVMKSGHPFGGPAGTTFDAVNYRKGGPWANAGRTIRFGSDDCVNMFYGPANPKKVDIKNPAEITKLIKQLGKYLGAVDVGIVDLGPDPLKWFMKDDFLGHPLHFKPEENRYAIVSLSEEELVSPPLQTGMSIATVHYQAKVARGYFLDDYVAGHIAQFIRALGYHAIGHNNGHVKSVPVAMMAGLGELGRYGNLMTLKWGPNVRICTVTTDLTLIPDKPVDIGVQDFCSMCTRCYDYCPMNSIPIEKSYFMGVQKWKVNLWRCRQSSQAGLEGDLLHSETCTICRDVCPFAKPSNFANILGRTFASRSHLGRKMLIKLDDFLLGKWNKHGIGEVIKKARQKMIRVAKGIGPNGGEKDAYPQPPSVELWLTEGANSPAARDQAADIARKLGVNVIVKEGATYENVPCPTYPDEAFSDPRFGKWPTWTDPWGRTIEGYEHGKKGFPRLDFRPLSEKTCSAVTSGIGPTIFGYEPINVSPQFHGYTLHDTMAADPFQ
ncbi:MAG TPA: reductive dehalogenase domain-containing protein [Desulfatiglandales bacterium]|nr:reductive dehalogenase domain-containing protein [Desulfatiglandales bacterium]